MVEQLVDMDHVFHALSHSARRDMLSHLASAECTVGELAAPFAMSLAAASKHIKVLEQAGLVERTVQGRRHVCRLAAEPLEDAAAWIERYRTFWEASFDRLDAHLRELQKGQTDD